MPSLRDKIFDNYSLLRSWYWVLSDPIDDELKQHWPSLTFAKNEPPEVGNPSMKWERPSLETIITYHERWKRDYFIKRFEDEKRIKFNRSHALLN